MTAIQSSDFARTPLPQLLAFMLKKAMSGTLVVRGIDGSTTHKLYFDAGRPAHAEGGRSVSRLGELLVVRGIINAKTLASSLRGTKERGVLLGRYLLDEGHVTREALTAVMRFQLEQKIVEMYELMAEPFEVHEGENLTRVPASEMFPLDPVHSMPRALREKWASQRIEGQLARLEGHGLRFSGRGLGDPAWSEEERQALTIFRTRVHTLSSSMQAEPNLAASMRIVLYVLMLTSGIDVVEPPRPADVGPPAPRIAASSAPTQEPPGPTEKIESMRTEAQDMIAIINEGDLFRILGVAEDVPLEKVRSSYLALVKRFHPDRGASVGDAQLRENLVFISSKLREAVDTLSDPERRAEYSKQRAGGRSKSEEDAIVHEALASEMAFQKASILVRRRKWNGALSLMKPVVKAHSDNGEYLATLTWCRFNMAGPGDDLSEMEASLRQAVSLAPRSEKANHYLAQVLKRTGKETEARKFLEVVAGINPHNIEVKRELHILERRHTGSLRPQPGITQGMSREQQKEDRGSDPPAGQETTMGKLKKLLTKKL